MDIIQKNLSHVKYVLVQKGIWYMSELVSEIEKDKKQPTNHQIPCPDNNPGCCVFHYEEKMSKEDESFNQGLSSASSLIKKRMKN